MAQVIDRWRLQGMLEHGAQLVEVLPAREYDEDHIPGAISIPLSKIDRESLEALDPERPVIVYCWDTA
ncbi:MAG TPA: rhodanese-like domain-containing protein [Candidatus Dormibacteraeota bacterium]|nr:rhodanese-like domain-containing protein [Candidatus Dormibacteraeota bacterium]